MSMNVLTTELQQSNGADDNDVHKRGKGDWQLIFRCSDVTE